MTPDITEEEDDQLSLAAFYRVAGDIPPWRIRLDPPPGTATEEDVHRFEGALRKRLCELVDGVLVEKPIGARESGLAIWLATLLKTWVKSRKLGKVLGEAGMVRTTGRRYRMPDVSFLSWAKFPEPESAGRKVYASPDLAVEILSESNTPTEMAVKRGEYFAAGTRLVWEVSPDARTVRVYTAPEVFTDLTGGDTLTGGEVLPGFAVTLSEIFEELDERP